LLSAEAVAAYLAARFPQQQFPAALAPWLQQRTDGQPLFLVTLVQAFVAQGVLHTHDGRWTVQGSIDTLTLEVPESLRQMLEQQITRLSLEGQRVLEVASVAGVEFVAAAVAAGLEADAEGQISGAAGRNQPGAAVAAAGQAGSSAPAPGRGLRQVHRGV
jgi:predicted ATPase